MMQKTEYFNLMEWCFQRKDWSLVFEYFTRCKHHLTPMKRLEWTVIEDRVTLFVNPLSLPRFLSTLWLSYPIKTKKSLKKRQRRIKSGVYSTYSRNALFTNSTLWKGAAELYDKRSIWFIIYISLSPKCQEKKKPASLISFNYHIVSEMKTMKQDTF